MDICTIRAETCYFKKSLERDFLLLTTFSDIPFESILGLDLKGILLYMTGAIQ